MQSNMFCFCPNLKPLIHIWNPYIFPVVVSVLGSSVHFIVMITRRLFGLQFGRNKKRIENIGRYNGLNACKPHMTHRQKRVNASCLCETHRSDRYFGGFSPGNTLLICISIFFQELMSERIRLFVYQVGVHRFIVSYK